MGRRGRARRLGRLVLVTVDHWPGDTCPTRLERLRTDARLLALADLAQDEAPAVPVSTEVLDGLPGPALVAGARQAELLVLGAAGHGGAATTAHCTAHAACPGVVVPLPRAVAVTR